MCHFIGNDVLEVIDLLISIVFHVVEIITHKNVSLGVVFPVDYFFPKGSSVNVSDDGCFQCWCFKK
jgi:hypothetical protein